MIDNIESLQSLYLKNCYISSRQLLNEIYATDYAIVKGEPLSFLSYGKFGQRYSSDIDILLPKEALPEIERVLIGSGYKCATCSRADHVLLLTSSHQVLPWRKAIPPFGDVLIDLNFDLFWGEYTGKRICISEFLSDAIEMDIYGVRVKTLHPLKAMIQLVLHNYKDMNSLFLIATRKHIKIDMFKDVYYLLKNNLDSISINKFYLLSEKYEIIPYVYYVLYYTGQVFDDEVLKQYIEAFRNSDGEALLNYYGLCNKERKEWKCDFKTRLESENLYDLILDDLTKNDIEKIAINKRIFMGASE